MSREIWRIIWQIQVATTCECIYQRHWGPYPERQEIGYYPLFQTQVRDRLFWDETFRNQRK